MTKIEEFAQAFTAAVQDAFVKVYGPPAKEEHLSSVRPSWDSTASSRAGTTRIRALSWWAPNTDGSTILIALQPTIESGKRSRRS
jgi:hypothetical protein